MNDLLELLLKPYRRLDDLNERRWFVIAGAVLALAVTATLFGPLVAASLDLEGQRRALVQALDGANVRDGDPVAVELRDSGRVRIGDVVYGDEVLAERPDLIFDPEGTVLNPETLAEVLLRPMYPAHLPRWMLERSRTTLLLAGLTLAMLSLVFVMRLAAPFALTVLATGLAAGLARASGSVEATWALAGVGILAFSFVVLMRGMMILLDRPDPTLAVAHTVLREAARTRIPLVFIVVLLVALPIIPLGLDPEQPLRFRLQTFISRSLSTTFYVAAAMTLFLACATVAFEIRDRQIWHVITKPVARAQYLVGKWIGILAVNLVVLVIAGVSIFTFIQYLREQPVVAGLQGQEDLLQVKDAVLTAREGRRPDYPRLEPDQIRTRVEQAIERDPELAMLDEVPIERRRALAAQIVQQFDASQRSVLPGPEGMREFVFSGLDRVVGTDTTLTLRYRFYIYRDDEHQVYPARFILNGDPRLAVQRNYVPTMAHVLQIPASMVREDGTISVAILNLFPYAERIAGNGAINFEEGDFELLYPVGSFEANFARAMVVHWVKLGFLGILGVVFGGFLNFPVACLAGFTVLVAGTAAPFLARSLETYYPPEVSTMDWTDPGLVIRWAFQSSIKGIASATVWLLESFGRYRPTQSLVEGRLIPLGEVFSAVLRIGVLWSGLALAVGWAVLRKRQLAIYSGQGG